MRIPVLRLIERVLLVAGVLLLTSYAAVMGYRSISSRAALREFDSNAAAAPAVAPAVALQPLELPGEHETDFSLWSAERTHSYRKSLQAQQGSVLAVMRIERLNIRVPVLEGTDEWALNRGVGWIAGTARPGEAGNIGIAGHRDGFFRGLKDVTPGDVIEVSTVRATNKYTVDQIRIVKPSDVSVLRPRGEPSLTLVTCYPFYFIGDAPKRFIVHAASKEQTQPGNP